MPKFCVIQILVLVKNKLQNIFGVKFLEQKCVCRLDLKTKRLTKREVHQDPSKEKAHQEQAWIRTENTHAGGHHSNRIQGSQDNQETIQEERFSKWRSGKIKMQHLSWQMKGK